MEREKIARRYAWIYMIVLYRNKKDQERTILPCALNFAQGRL